MTTENPLTEKITAEVSDKGVGCRNLLGEGESQTPRTDAEILLCSDGTTAVPASLARIMEREIAVLTKCHEDNCRSISQLANELGQSRAAERLARVQLENARKERDSLRVRAEKYEQEIIDLRVLARVIEPFASEQACNRREMKIHDACRDLRPMIYREPVSPNDAAIIIGRTAKRGGWNA